MGIAAVSNKIALDPAATAKIAASKAGTRPTPPPDAGSRPQAAAAKSTAASSTASSSARIYDKRDLNQDGTVSAQEIIQYSMKYPVMQTNDQAASATVKQESEVSYNRLGKLANNTNLLTGNINTSA
jgi:hypothetical protein